MVEIAFCDDDLSELNEIRMLLEQYRVERGQQMNCKAFQSPFDLLAEIEKGVRYDILFLDILMPGETGINASAEIRKYDRNVKIIFLTSSSEFAVESYTVGAYFYQLMPVRKETFFHLMDSVLMTCQKEQISSLILRCKNGIHRIDPCQLEYCEVFHRTLFIHLTSGKVLECIGSLDEFGRQLEHYGNFLRPHRSFLVNLEYVQKISYRAITMSCLAEIPIPRGKYNEIKNAFLEYAFQDGKVTI